MKIFPMKLERNHVAFFQKIQDITKLESIHFLSVKSNLMSNLFDRRFWSFRQDYFSCNKSRTNLWTPVTDSCQQHMKSLLLGTDLLVSLVRICLKSDNEYCGYYLRKCRIQQKIESIHIWSTESNSIPNLLVISSTLLQP